MKQYETTWPAHFDQFCSNHLCVRVASWVWFLGSWGSGHPDTPWHHPVTRAAEGNLAKGAGKATCTVRVYSEVCWCFNCTPQDLSREWKSVLCFLGTIGRFSNNEKSGNCRLHRLWAEVLLCLVMYSYLHIFANIYGWYSDYIYININKSIVKQMK